MTKRVEHAYAILTWLVMTGMLAVDGAAAATSGYRIKPSDVQVPPDVALGEYERIIRPFENWTLICDENLEANQKVCNVTQVIEDKAGHTVFSWSLAATNDGKPYMILRAAADARKDAALSLKFEGQERPIAVRIRGCDASVCLALLPIDQIMREKISEGSAPTISYMTTDGKKVSVTASLKGLQTAVGAIN